MCLWHIECSAGPPGVSEHLGTDCASRNGIAPVPEERESVRARVWGGGCERGGSKEGGGGGERERERKRDSRDRSPPPAPLPPRTAPRLLPAGTNPVTPAKKWSNLIRSRVPFQLNPDPPAGAGAFSVIGTVGGGTAPSLDRNLSALPRRLLPSRPDPEGTPPPFPISGLSESLRAAGPRALDESAASRTPLPPASKTPPP